MSAGIDISKWQATTPSLTGLDFAFARSTYATTVDPKYAMHTAAFRAAGLVVGAYHFGVGFVSPAEQVRAFLAVAKNADLLALDLERDSTATMTAAQAREFIAAIHAAGRTVGLYHSRSGFPSLGQDWNWVAKWGTTPPDMTWAFWQWQGSPLDRDKFNGDITKLRQLIPQEAEMAAAITDERPGLMNVPAGTALYDLDSKTVLTKLSSALTDRPSPYGVGGRRAIFTTIGGVRRVALVLPTAWWPVPPADCAAAIASATAPFVARIAAAKAALG